MEKLNDRTVASLSPKPGKQYEISVGNGLRVRVSPGGTKTWVFVFESEGRRYRYRLGDVTGMTLKEARQALDVARGRLARGDNPATARAEARRTSVSAPTVAELADAYLERWARPRKRSWRDDERRLRKHVLPAWGRRKATDITRRDVVALLNGLVADGYGAGANRVLAVTRRMFSWSVEQSILDHSPCTHVKPPAEERRRDRVLSDAEIRLFWEGLTSAPMAEGTRAALRVQLATALRAGEVVGARWEDIDFESLIWTIPRERSKNKSAHRLPLSDLVRDELLRQRERSGHTAWVFPDPTGRKAMSTQAISKALQRSRSRFGINARFVPHDLRRTAATGMARLGVMQSIIARVLNHTDRSVTSIYVIHGYDAEKRQAFDAWARRLEEIVERRSECPATSRPS